MKCSKPYVGNDGLAFGCGQCMGCRVNRRRVWVHRIMLEAMQYEASSFVTLTYGDDALPEGGTLVPKDPQDWLKRLRKAVQPSRLRFFLVGEYGDETFRPHYHAALFGFPGCVFGRSRYGSLRPGSSCCHWCDLVRDTWGRGHILLGTLEDASAGYLAGYVTKKMTAKDDPRLLGRHPEFGRMSLRPGIGMNALWDIADRLMKFDKLPVDDDVPGTLRHGRVEKPLGRYLRNKLRLLVGRDEGLSELAMAHLQAEMRQLQMAAKYDPEAPTVRAQILKQNAGLRDRLQSREKLRKKRAVL